MSFVSLLLDPVPHDALALTLRSSFSNVAEMVFRRLKEIPPHQIVRLWHKAVLHMFEYMALKPL